MASVGVSLIDLDASDGGGFVTSVLGGDYSHVDLEIHNLLPLTADFGSKR